PIDNAGIDQIASAHEVLLPANGPTDLRIPQTTILVVRTMVVDDRLLASMPKLKLIVKHGSGIDNIDIPAASRRGILVANTPGGANATAVAEGAVTLMLAVLRRVRDMDALVRNGRFQERQRIQLRDLTGARIGLIGFGRIARV